MFDPSLIKNLINFELTPKSFSGKGGDGGEIILISEKFSGDGTVSAEGGKGIIGGKGGKIHIRTKHNNFTGKLSAKGG